MEAKDVRHLGQLTPDIPCPRDSCSSSAPDGLTQGLRLRAQLSQWHYVQLQPGKEAWWSLNDASLRNEDAAKPSSPDMIMVNQNIAHSSSVIRRQCSGPSLRHNPKKKIDNVILQERLRFQPVSRRYSGMAFRAPSRYKCSDIPDVEQVVVF